MTMRREQPTATQMRMTRRLTELDGASELFLDDGSDARPIEFVTEVDFTAWLAAQPGTTAAHVARTGFTGQTGAILYLSDASRIVAGIGPTLDRWSVAAVPALLPPGKYVFGPSLASADLLEAMIGWGVGNYEFDCYRPARREMAKLVWKGVDCDLVTTMVTGDAICRDLINIPAEDMGPSDIEDAVRSLAMNYRAEISVLTGPDLLEAGYALIHAVGRASTRPPRLIDLRWGRSGDPLVTLVGKGVCFDTGGLDMKSSAGMLDMKYDMGGAAHVIALAAMIMRLRLPVKLRMLVPAVDNAIGGNAIRPRDVIRARNGMTVEIGNTDAEGRLILAEPLAEAAGEQPAVLLDMATLTGAARVALGADITALFCNDEILSSDLLAAGSRFADPLWRLPLWQAYAADLRGDVADLNNVADLNLGATTHAGAIYAALFLQAFVAPGVSWAHLDILAGNGRARPGRPRGAATRGLFAALGAIMERFPRTSSTPSKSG